MSKPLDLNDLPIDLSALIRVLEKVNRETTREAQAATLERELVAAELNPSPIDFLNLSDAVNLLNAADLPGRGWEQADADLAGFFITR